MSDLVSMIAGGLQRYRDFVKKRYKKAKLEGDAKRKVKEKYGDSQTGTMADEGKEAADKAKERKQTGGSILKEMEKSGL